jgi:catechol 2,3-dioxygenase-like lactoylglutathione lyase family enzyme
MTLTHVQLFSVPVSDQERAKRFYLDVLGFDLLREGPFEPGRQWVQVAPPGAATSITLVNWFDSMPPGSLQGLVLETDDLDGDLARLAGRGLDAGPVQEAPWGRFVTIADPDGNGIVLQATSAEPPAPGA